MERSGRTQEDLGTDLLGRRSIRLAEYDYSRDGAYFVTVCVQDQRCPFGEIERGLVRLNEAGRMVESVWQVLPRRFPTLVLDEFIVMPNHVHGILVLAGFARPTGEPCVHPVQQEGEHKVRPYGQARNVVANRRPRGTEASSLGRVMQAFKSMTTDEYIRGVKTKGWEPFPGHLWQRNYYEHIIRNEQDLHDTRAYIRNNPASWAQDDENPTRVIPPHA